MNNDVSAAPLGKFYADGMARFDRLPTKIRRALHEAVCDWCPGAVLQSIDRLVRNGWTREDAVSAVIAVLHSSDVKEIEKFGRDYRQRGYGPYPFLAAKGSIMRYDERRFRSEQSPP